MSYSHEKSLRLIAVKSFKKTMSIVSTFDLYERDFSLSHQTKHQQSFINGWIDKEFIEFVRGIETHGTTICKEYRLTELGKAKLMMDKL